MTLSKYKFSKKLYIIFFCFVATIPFSSFPKKEGYSIGETIYWYGASILVIYLHLWLLLFFTEGVKLKKGSNETYVKIGIWGYLWRYLFALALSIVLLAVSSVLMSMDFNYLFMMPLSIFYYFILTYLLFCRNKKEKRQEVMLFIRQVSI